MWLFRTSLDAARAGHLDGGYGFEANLFQRIQEIRAQGNYMSAVLVGRIPFAYIHIVQVLVDAVLWAYPIMAFSSGLSLQMGVAGAMLLTTTYQGLFDLAKRFLDPFHNENFWQGDDPIMVSTLIAETNAGSTRWIYGLEDMPISMSMIKSGDLDSFVLPEEGYTAEEATLREQLRNKVQLEEEEDLEEEFEEARAILNAPPGYDFVPGIDDIDQTNTTDVLEAVEGDLEWNRDMYNQFVETAVEEYEELKESATQEEGSPTGDLNP